MKVKVKVGQSKKFYDAIDLADLHRLVTEENNLSETVILSLNGKDPIPSSGSFSEHDIVQGDILRAIEAPPRQATPPPTPSTLDDILSKFELTKVNDQTYQYRFGGDILITQTPLGPTTLMNIIAKVDNQTKVENIMIERFSDSVAEIEQKLKSQIEQCREWVGLRPAGGFLSCPDEILMKVINKLNAKSLIALGATCVKLREMASDENVWKKLYIRDFTTMSDESISWRRLYLQAKRERVLRDRAPRPSRSEPILPYAVPGHYQPQIPDNPMIPGMIGGEYDLRPGGGGLGFPGLRGPPIRGDPPNHPGLMIDPDYNRSRHPDHGNDHHGLFNPDGSLSFNRNRGRNDRNNPFNPFGGGFM